MAIINTGVAFGIWTEVPNWIVLGAFGVLIACALKTRELWERIGIMMIFLGGAVNTYQRLILGGVVDNWEIWGVGYNNLADYLIFFGLVVYGYTYFRTTRKLGESASRKVR